MIFQYTLFYGDDNFQVKWDCLDAIPDREQQLFREMLADGSTCMASPTEVLEIINEEETK